MRPNELRSRRYEKRCGCGISLPRFDNPNWLAQFPDQHCKTCFGTGVAEMRCRECFTWKGVGVFMTRNGVVKRCSGCRGRGRTKTHKDPAGIPQDGKLFVKFARVSRNRKTGPIPVAMTSANTCPKSCPWKGNGCYAEQHFVAIHWRRLSRGNGITWDAFVDKIAALPQGQLWRMGEAGDLPGDGDVIDCNLLRQLTKAAEHTRGFAYTHKPMLGTEIGAWNRSALANSGGPGLTINLSADSLEQADKLADLGIAPVTVVLPMRTRRSLRTPGGRRVVVCPAITSETISCQTCQLCAKSHRSSIVGFPAHGDMRKRMNTELTQLRLFPK